MTISARPAELSEIESFRDIYRLEMGCQIIHDSIHTRPGWTQEYILNGDETPIGYGSVAISGPWKEKPTLYEFFVIPPFRTQAFEAFEALLQASKAKRCETQSNDACTRDMLFTYSPSVTCEAILFQDERPNSTSPADDSIVFRKVLESDAGALEKVGLESGDQWLLQHRESVIATGGILYHYNRPYGDIYMAVAEPFRRRGFGTRMVQELKQVCYVTGSVPAARCNVRNVASRLTLQKAGFVPCGHILVGDVSLTAD